MKNFPTIELPFYTIKWLDQYLSILDQRELPRQEIYRNLKNKDDVCQAIKTLAVRGAPAIGVAAALGLAMCVAELADDNAFSSGVHALANLIKSTRPTAVNLHWAVDRLVAVLARNEKLAVASLKELLLQEALAIQKEDQASCYRIGVLGAELINDGDVILTHCNAGALATAGIGTALAVIYVAHAQGKKIQVFSDETRPLLQG